MPYQRLALRTKASSSLLNRAGSSKNGECPLSEYNEMLAPVSDIDIAVVDSLKALDPKRPIREADMARGLGCCR